MIAVDTSSFIAYLSGLEGSDVEALDGALRHSQACLPPLVLTELLSDPKLVTSVVALFRQLPLLEVTDGYWQRAGALRASVWSTGRKVPLADALIAQSCLDHDVPLITRNRDFRQFARESSLKLLA